jgi:integrase
VATILSRKRADGSIGHTALITIKKGGKIAHREAKTFDRKQAASAWAERRETELKRPGGLERRDDPKLRDVIDKYIAEAKTAIGRTKTQVLRTIKEYEIADMRCSEIASAHLITFAQSLPVQPQTVQNYLSHLGAIFAVARPAWGYPLNKEAIQDAMVVAKRLGVISKGRERDRRPTLDELNRLMDHFGTIKTRRPKSVPMQMIIPFAIFSTRRQEEITRILWDDYQAAFKTDPPRVLVRDMKHPGDKAGNDIWCELPPEAAAYIESMPKRGKEVFPYTTDAIGAAFTRACNILGINTEEMEDSERLHFHDLRHDGISRLFEMGRTIPQAASVSGHRSWTSLKRYTHVRQLGDKYANWKWQMPIVSP